MKKNATALSCVLWMKPANTWSANCLVRINGPFPQSRRQTAGFLVRRTKVRLRTTPCYPWPCGKFLIYELETYNAHSGINGWTVNRCWDGYFKGLWEFCSHYRNPKACHIPQHRVWRRAITSGKRIRRNFFCLRLHIFIWCDVYIEVLSVDSLDVGKNNLQFWSYFYLL